MSAKGCGCDLEAGYQCQSHRKYPPTCFSCGHHPCECVTPYEDQEADVHEVRAPIQAFDTGATRNVDTHKYDYEGFLNPEVLHAFGAYMHRHRVQKDGSVRASDNWQRGMPPEVYMKSLVRHVIDLWRVHRGGTVTNPDDGAVSTAEELCCAIMFNVMGYLKETLDANRT